MYYRGKNVIEFSHKKSPYINILFTISYSVIYILFLSTYYYLLIMIITIIIGSSELRSKRSDFVRERRDCVRSSLPDSIGCCGTYHDIITIVYDRPLHGTPRIPEPRVQTRYARNEERTFGIQPGTFSRTI